MKTTKHTPAPWKVVHVTKHPFDTNGQVAFVQSSKQSCFDFSANENENMTRDEFTANAYLIAAAPELFEVLEQFTNACDTHSPIDLFNELGRIVQKAKSAISKARGL